MIMDLILKSSIQQFEKYKSLAEHTFSQVPDDALFWQINEESNSIATIVKHMNGNMISRWTNFLTSDGEKEWRMRDAEFYNDIKTRKQMLTIWEKGWQCLFNALKDLSQPDLIKIVYIREQPQTVIDAIQRQIAHYAYHVGQIVYIGKVIQNTKWQTLSIAKGQSKQYLANLTKK